VTIHLEGVDLGEGVAAWFTGRDRDRPEPPVGAAGNLSHRRPHRPADLARARREVAEVVGVPADRWHLMHQVHGAEVAGIDEQTPAGTELRGVDALVTACAERALVVQVADCVPVLLAGPGGVAAVHAGRMGVAAGIVGRAVRRLVGTSPDESVRAAIGPAIGGCCYEVPVELREQVAAVSPAAWATTRWGTPSLDLPAAVQSQLAEVGVTHVERAGGCTFEDERFFSHRRDPWAGRQVGIVVKQEAA
jgi:polyphenol oxidase